AGAGREQTCRVHLQRLSHVHRRDVWSLLPRYFHLRGGWSYHWNSLSVGKRWHAGYSRDPGAHSLGVDLVVRSVCCVESEAEAMTLAADDVVRKNERQATLANRLPRLNLPHLRR